MPEDEVAVQIEIWSDVVCPWCYVGKRRFESALERFAHRDAVAVRWRSFQLDPGSPRVHDRPTTEHLASKYGVTPAKARAMEDRMTEVAAGEGLTYRFDIARRGNTFDAHRLLHLAADRRLQGPVKERLMAAYFTEGEAIGEAEVLARVVSAAGLDRDEAGEVLGGDAYADAVRADEALARSLGISGVPFFVVDRAYGVSGAQPADVLLRVLEQAWSEQANNSDGGAGTGPHTLTSPNW